ncbi:MAG TPA: phosphatase PAP2 family protein [Mycobacteriales bacterium]|nr:phosphatase PAP2 family protein [Mycobacteriales bacterium]
MSTPAPVTTPPRSGRALPGQAALAALACFVVLLLLVDGGWRPLADLDATVLERLNRVATASATFVTANQAVSLLGTFGCYVALGAPLVLHLVRRDRQRAAVFVSLVGLGGSLLNTLVKALVDRARPVLEDAVASAAHSAFPSGHAQGVVVATGVLLLVLGPGLRPHHRRLAVALAVGWVLLMGFSRLALGVHYVSDVLGGYLLGLAWLAAWVAVFAGDLGRRGRQE